MKKFYEEPILETTLIVDVVTDEVDTPIPTSDGELSDGVI